MKRVGKREGVGKRVSLRGFLPAKSARPAFRHCPERFLDKFPESFADSSKKVLEI